MVTELIVFSELYTQNTQTKKTVTSIRFIDVSVAFVQTPLPPSGKIGEGEFSLLLHISPPAPYLMLGEGSVYRLIFLLLQIYSRSRNNGETQWHPCLLIDKASSYIMELLGSCLECVASVERGSELGQLALQAIEFAQYSFTVHNKVVVAENLGSVLQFHLKDIENVYS